VLQRSYESADGTRNIPLLLAFRGMNKMMSKGAVSG
jgi:hypothetical protein